MATLNEQEFNDQPEKQNKPFSSSSNLILSNQQSSKFELITSTTSTQTNSNSSKANQTTFRTINSNQLNKTESTTGNAKLIGFGPVGLNNLNLNGTKITGKLVAVRKDGNSYTFTTNTTSTINSTAKTFTLATPSTKGNTTLITVSRPQLATLNSSKAIASDGSTLVSSGTPQRLYYNQTTIGQKNSIALDQAIVQGDAQINDNKINTAKPIILQMKRKIQVLNDETRKTARIFTIPTSTTNLINKQTNLSNQFIVMNRPLLKPNLAANSGGLIKAKTTTTSIATRPTANLSALESDAVLNENQSSSQATNDSILKLNSSELMQRKTSETAAIATIKPISNELTNSIDNGMDTKVNIKPKFDTKMLSIENEIPNNLSTQTIADTLLLERSAGGLSTAVVIEQEEQQNLLDTNSPNDANKTVNVDTENFLFEKLTADEIIENCFVIENRLNGDATTIENLIESTIENSFQTSTTHTAGSSATASIDTCVKHHLLVNNTSDCIEIEQDIEFNPNSTTAARDEERSVSLNASQSLTNSNCSSLFNMQT